MKKGIFGVFVLCALFLTLMSCGSSVPTEDLFDAEFSDQDEVVLTKEVTGVANYHTLIFPLDRSLLPISSYLNRHFSVRLKAPDSDQFVSVNRDTTPQAYVRGRPSTDIFEFRAQRLTTGTTYTFLVCAALDDGSQQFCYEPFVGTTRGNVPLNPDHGALTLPEVSAAFPFQLSLLRATQHLLEFSLTRNDQSLPLYASYNIYLCSLIGASCVELKRDTFPQGRILGSLANNNFRFLLNYLTPGTSYRAVFCANVKNSSQKDCSASIEGLTLGPAPIVFPPPPEPTPDPDPVPPPPGPVCGVWPQNVGSLNAASIVAAVPADSQWYPDPLGTNHFKFSFNNYLRPECDITYANYEVFVSPSGSGCWTRADATTTPSAVFTYDWCHITGVLVHVAGITQPTDVILRVGSAGFAESTTVPIGTHNGAGNVVYLNTIAGVPGTVGDPNPVPPPSPPPSPDPDPVPPPPPPPSGDVSEDPFAVVSQPDLLLQAFNLSFSDPVFGTSIRRITNRVASGGYGTQLYSQLQAFSADNQYVLLNEDDSYIVRRLDTLGAQPLDLSDKNAPRWHPAIAHSLVAYDSNGDATLRVEYIDVDTAGVTTRFIFPSSYQRIRGNQSFDELSEDGVWMGGMASMSNGDQRLFALNLQTQTLGAEISLGALYSGACAPDPTWGIVEPDWIGISPRGNYLVVQWPGDGTARCHGLETFDINTGAFVGRVYDSHQHGDLGVRADGSEFFMTYEIYHPSGRLSIGVRDLPGTATVSPPQYIQLLNWGNGEHISCRGPAGVCLITAGFDLSNGRDPFEGEIFLQYVDGRVKRLTQHRSTSCGYWVQPRASISRDGRYAIFASDWGTSLCNSNNLGRGEAYVIQMP